VVVLPGWTCRDPLAGTAPMPLSMLTVSAPSTSHVSVVGEPEGIVTGETEKRWIVSC
jgi:hypothetical protein